MLKLTDRAAITAALTNQSLDPELRALIGLRAGQLDDVRRQPLGETVKFVVVQPGDLPGEIHRAVGFAICWDQAEQPSFEWIRDHGSHFELGYQLTMNRWLIVFVADDPGTDSTLRFNCLAVADRQPNKKNKP